MAHQFNLWGQNWWQQQQQKNAKEPVPDICSFCGVPIKEDDIYWLGYDRHMIFASVCDGLYCKTWLEYKAQRKKVK